MDAAALLTRHGWRGAGHSLDNGGRGIKKPLLVSTKRDLSGVGQKSKAVRTSDQWWARALDEGLKELGTGNKTTLATVREKGVSQGGLYGFFVKGEGLEGTIGEESEEMDTEGSTPATSLSEKDDDTADDTSESEEAGSRDESSADENSASENEESETDEVTMKGKIKKRKRAEKEQKNGEGNKRQKGDKQDTNESTEKSRLQPALEHVAKIIRRSTMLIKQQAKRGEFGTVMPHPTLAPENLGKSPKDVWKARAETAKKPEKKGRTPATPAVETGGESGMHADRMRMLNLSAAPQPEPIHQEPPKAEKKMTYKAAKFTRKKATREAKRALKARLIQEAQERGELPGMEGLDPDAILAKHKKLYKAEGKEQKATFKATQKQEKQQAKLLREEKKKAKRVPMNEQRKKQNKADVELSGQRELDDKKLDEAQDFLKGEDFVPLTTEATKGEKKRRKYSLTIEEKKERKLKSQAASKGISLEEHQANITNERRIAEERTAKLTREHRIKDLLAAAKSLTPEQRKDYEARAKAKGMTVEAYHTRRLEKKAEKKADKKEIKQGEKEEQATEDSLGFVIDTQGDATLPVAAPVYTSSHSKSSSKAAATTAGGLPLDPAIWEGREAKSLTKAERKARLEWLRQRRRERKAALGQSIRTAKEKGQ